MVKFSHSVFALPFAFTGALLAQEGLPSFIKIIWITIAMIGARSGAMGINRIIDKNIDALNPRTKTREIPLGKIKIIEAWLFVIFSFMVLIFSAYKLNPLCLKLAPLSILLLFAYSYTKRFTWLSHIVLGIAISGAPLGAWIAIKGTINFEILPLCIAVIFWLAGFDILYAIEDISFDKKYGLYSIPQRFGIVRSIIISRLFHTITWLLLILTGIIFGLNIFYWLGIIIVAVLLIYEHALIKSDDLRKLNVAFFNMNGYISITVFIFTLIAKIFAI